jgi:hypothetical protein
MSYHNKREAKVILSKLLRSAGFEIYGYKEDESDCMTDYWSPADWDGIATKGKYIAVVDNKGKSGFEILLNADELNNYRGKLAGLTIKDRERIESLERLAKDRAATEGEAETALLMIERIKNKNTDFVEVVAKYSKIDFPATNYMIFIYDTEQNCIVYKDSCLTHYDFYDFQIRIEEGIVKSRQVRDYDTNENKNELDDAEIKLLQDTLNIFNTLDFIKEGYYQEQSKTETTFDYIEKNDRIIDEKTYIKSWGGNYLRYLTTINKGIGICYHFRGIKTDGTFVQNKTYQSVYESDLKNCTKFYNQITVPKMVWKKANRGVAITYDNKDIKVQETKTNYTITKNEKLNGIEISFDKKPDTKILEGLKIIGMRWNSFSKVWYIKDKNDIKDKIMEVLKSA